MSKQSQGSMTIVGAIAGGVFLVAIVALMLVGGYTFSPALFLASLVAVAVAVFLLIALHRSSAAQEPTRLARGSSRTPTAAASRGASTQAAASAPAPEPANSAAPASAEAGTQPERLEAPREGGADDLKKIKGVGPKLEEALHNMGVFHFDQIASWSPAEVAWMDENLVEFRGRVSRDDWVAQAKQLASGSDPDSSRKVDGGEVYH